LTNPSHPSVLPPSQEYTKTVALLQQRPIKKSVVYLEPLGEISAQLQSLKNDLQTDFRAAAQASKPQYGTFRILQRPRGRGNVGSATGRRVEAVESTFGTTTVSKYCHVAINIIINNHTNPINYIVNWFIDV
jgi:hypothetical protein